MWFAEAIRVRNDRPFPADIPRAGDRAGRVQWPLDVQTRLRHPGRRAKSFGPLAKSHAPLHRDTPTPLGPRSIPLDDALMHELAPSPDRLGGSVATPNTTPADITRARRHSAESMNRP